MASKTPAPRRFRSSGYAISDANTIIKGNRAYIVKVRKACSDALKSGSGIVACLDEDGDDIVTTIVCSARFGRLAGLVPPSDSGAGQ